MLPKMSDSNSLKSIVRSLKLSCIVGKMQLYLIPQQRTKSIVQFFVMIKSLSVNQKIDLRVPSCIKSTLEHNRIALIKKFLNNEILRFILHKIVRFKILLSQSHVELWPGEAGKIFFDGVHFSEVPTQNSEHRISKNTTHNKLIFIYKMYNMEQFNPKNIKVHNQQNWIQNNRFFKVLNFSDVISQCQITSSK